MTFFDKLFTSKNKLCKTDGNAFLCTNASGDCRSVQPDQIRVLVFRECERRGRKLLFDSDAVEKIIIDRPCQITSFRDVVELNSSCAYRYKKPGNDVTSLAEMIFGSVAISITSTCSSSKIHRISTPRRRILFTNIIPTSCHNRGSSRQVSGNGSGSFESTCSFGKSSCFDSNPGLHRSSRSCDLINAHSANSSVFKTGDSLLLPPSNGCDATSTPDSYCSVQSLQGSCGSRCDSNVSCSGGSLTSLRRRWNKSFGASLEVVCADCDEPPVRVKTKLGLALLVTLDHPIETEIEKLLLKQSVAMEQILDSLRWQVEDAYLRREEFVHLTYGAFLRARCAVIDLMICRPQVSWPGNCNSTYKSNFVSGLNQILRECDGKSTNFFVSTLLTAVLTHNLNWVRTTAGAELSDMFSLLKSQKMGRVVLTGSERARDQLLALINIIIHFVPCPQLFENSYSMEFSTITTSNKTDFGYEETFDSGIDCELRESVMIAVECELPVRKCDVQLVQASAGRNVADRVKEKCARLYPSLAGLLKLESDTNVLRTRSKQCLEQKSTIVNEEVGVNSKLLANGSTDGQNCSNDPSIYPSVADLAKLECVRLDDLSCPDRTHVEKAPSPDEGYATLHNGSSVLFVVGQNDETDISHGKLLTDKKTAPLSTGTIDIKLGKDILRQRATTMNNRECLATDLKRDESIIEELTLPRCAAEKHTVPVPISSTVGAVTSNYNPHFSIQGVTLEPQDMEQLELRVQKELNASISDNGVIGAEGESCAIVADLHQWSVNLFSKRRTLSGIHPPVRVASSPLVADMLETFTHLCRMGLPPDFCLEHLERKMLEIFTLSRAAAELLLTNDSCTLELLTRRLDVAVTDVPLLLSVATTHSPHLADKYGISLS